MAVTVNAAVYGVAVYGVAIYGKIIVSNLDQATATGQVNAVQVNLSVTLASVVATGSVESLTAGGFEVDITEKIPTGVFATGQVSAVQVNVVESVTSVVGSGQTGDPVVTASSNIVSASVFATGFVEAVQENVSEKLGL